MLSCWSSSNFSNVFGMEVFEVGQFTVFDLYFVFDYSV